jgi:hypothetical protein
VSRSHPFWAEFGPLGLLRHVELGCVNDQLEFGAIAGLTAKRRSELLRAQGRLQRQIRCLAQYRAGERAIPQTFTAQHVRKLTRELRKDAEWARRGSMLFRANSIDGLETHDPSTTLTRWRQQGVDQRDVRRVRQRVR